MKMHVPLTMAKCNKCPECVHDDIRIYHAVIVELPKVLDYRYSPLIMLEVVLLPWLCQSCCSVAGTQWTTAAYLKTYPYFFHDLIDDGNGESRVVAIQRVQ